MLARKLQSKIADLCPQAFSLLITVLREKRLLLTILHSREVLLSEPFELYLTPQMGCCVTFP